ncbi:glycosyltransferase [Vibrio sp. IRLE0018]|uniref:glycosyltransferase n=1 Tax=Vibrio floridensis TaxID=2908007 RepID=UPI001F3EDA08|nr:glycosyltransferase [Vibrio floridensis]MCF8780322.1 glycosyltransferase [Vibrio floridensis]
MSVYRSDNLDHFKLAVESILRQSYSSTDLFIWRDGPVPESIDIYLDTLTGYKNVFITRAQENQGLAAALNAMIELVVSSRQYTFIARMDSDDISYQERIAKQVSFFLGNPSVDVIGTACREFGSSFALEAKVLPAKHDQLLDFSIVRCPFIHPSVMFRSDVFERPEIRYPTNTELTEDLALWYMLLCSGARFANISDVLMDYRLSEATLSRRTGIGKAFSEVKVRYYYMRKLNRVSARNVLGVASRLLFHVMPLPLIRFAYKYLR